MIEHNCNTMFMNEEVILDSHKKFLRYLYVVRFEDGSIYEQNEEDKAKIVSVGSCFSDVLELAKKSPIEQVALTDGTDVWLLDMRTGDFNYNEKTTVRLHDREVEYHNKRLVIFRRRYVNTMTGEEDESKIQYALGWQANTEVDKDSSNKQFIIFID